MKVSLSFTEIGNYIASHFDKQLDFYGYSPDIIEIKLTQKILLANIKISIKLKIEKIEGTKIYLSYSGSKGTEMLISGALLFMKETLSQIAGMISAAPGNQLIIDLNKVEEVKKVLETVQLQSIKVNESDVVITAILK